MKLYFFNLLLNNKTDKTVMIGFSLHLEDFLIDFKFSTTTSH